MLGFGDRSLNHLKSVFQDICSLPVEDDGWRFDAATVESEDIRTIDEYGGVRVRLTASLAGAVIRVQIDVGFGDAVTPAPLVAKYPTLLDLPAPELRIYPMVPVVAEKTEAIVKLAVLNTRFKDFFDLHHLGRNFQFDGELLVRAMTATFARRKTPLPDALPVGLSALFAEDVKKQTQWNAFCTRLASQKPPQLPEIVSYIAAFIVPPMHAAARHEQFVRTWSPQIQWATK